MWRQTLMAELDIFIVNWNSGTQLRECLESVSSASKEGIKLGSVVVVDNHSTDGSLEGISDLSLPLRIIRNHRNLGYAAACNQAAAGSRADYLLFLNPDARLFPDSLWKPVRFMERTENARIGICGVRHIDETGKYAPSCWRFPTLKIFLTEMTGLHYLSSRWFPRHSMSEGELSGSREVDHVMGAFFLVRNGLFRSLNGFDEAFFVYLEDVDFSLRARKAGYASFYLSEVAIFHRGGGTSRQVRDLRLFYALRSKLIFGRKHFSGLHAWLLFIAIFSIEPAARIARAACLRSEAQFRETVGAYRLLGPHFRSR